MQLFQGTVETAFDGIGIFIHNHGNLLQLHIFKETKMCIRDRATVETSAYRLAESIKKTQKRANALKNITIPSYQALVTEITNALEEKDREEFTRLKVIKRSAGK